MPGPVRTAPRPVARPSWNWLVPQSSARTRFFRAAPPRRRPAAPAPPRPPRGWPGPLPHPRPALTCSLAQPQTLAVGSPRSLQAGRGRVGRGARGHGKRRRAGYIVTAFEIPKPFLVASTLVLQERGTLNCHDCLKHS
ncbi:uncharacterized protein LOC113253240 isoform X2 [Ursus arctos]|uniref:uncharacterized protein LOC113253240 isoform X2 n=1 Tax=Ursus arctos TaxID=9644 RepID=UPI0025480950|nr:uncharacterized protein LOC113253240 isoform X2 [Ursus arctos]